MTTDPLVARARALWEELAAAPVRFGPRGSVDAAVSPRSALCPPGWLGAVVLDGAAIVTAPDAATSAAVARLRAGDLSDPEAVARCLPVTRVLGPASLAYVSADAFTPTGAAAVERLTAGHPDIRRMEATLDEADADEAGLAAITSPAFVVSERGEVVAVAGYERWPRDTAHVSVATAAACRGRGLARTAGAAAVAHALAAGLLPQWRARPPESRRVAAALGFRELGTQLSVKVGATDGA